MKLNEPQENKNRLRHIRKSLLIGKTELARRAGVSPHTIDRIEKGFSCHLNTQRKIVQALGLGLSDMPRVFPPSKP